MSQMSRSLKPALAIRRCCFLLEPYVLLPKFDRWQHGWRCCFSFFLAAGTSGRICRRGRAVCRRARPYRRVMGANPSADVLVFVLAPEKLVGWSAPRPGVSAPMFRQNSRDCRLSAADPPRPRGDGPLVARHAPRPDHRVGPGLARGRGARRLGSAADRSPLHRSRQQHPDHPGNVAERSGRCSALAQRGEDLGHYADYAIDALRGRLLIAPADERPLVYYGRGPDGLETGLAGSQAMADIDQAGVINVAARLGRGELTRVTRDQIFAWNPAIIIAQDRSFYNALLRSRAWRGLIAVAKKRVYLAPADPFGWIDDPPA